MRHHYFVWYRVSDDGPDAELAIRSMMARLACRTGVAGRLMKKRGEPRLWMEIYEDVADPGVFESRLAQAVDEYDVEMFLADARRVECFTADAVVPPACATAVDPAQGARS